MSAEKSPRPANADAGSEPELGYEQAREELIEVVRRLEAGGTGLEESLALWERGERLAGICADWLDGARRRLDEVVAAGRVTGSGSDSGSDSGSP